MSKNKKVLVAMSGGIDSTVTAMMLHHEGYEVVGITMKTWDHTSSGTVGKETGCCNVDSFNDARQVAVDLGFPHYILDIREEFTESVVQNFVDEYLAGRTPNPCVLCNTHIKWAALLKRADALGCDWIATGHYANIELVNNRYTIRKGKDETKDQSYVLWGLSQDVLSRTLLPLGKFHKSEIRQMALEWGYEKLSQKGESYEICFVPDNNYRNFLNHRIEGLSERVTGGKFVDKHGNILGEHEGYPFYTIGQRRGLRIAMGTPVYVTAIDPDSNTVVIGEESDLLSQKMVVGKINLMQNMNVGEQQEAIVKIRYNNSGSPAWITLEDNGEITVIFQEPVKSIAPGQSAVFYDRDCVIGGGIIKS